MALTTAAAVAAAVVALLATAVPAAAVSPPSGRFVDDDGLRVEGFAEVLAQRGVVAGCAGDTGRLCPFATLSRGQMASLVARALLLPPPRQDHFSDDNGNVHESAINQLADAGLVAGRASLQFAPAETVTRGQTATILAAAFRLPGSSVDAFSDDDASVHEPSIDAARAAGVVEECGAWALTYCPDAPITRGDMVTFVAKSMGLPPVPPIRLGRVSDLPLPLVFAHRGGARLYPENTMQAFRSIVGRGSRILEMDVRTLADGGLGVMHDATLDRTTLSAGPVATSTTIAWRGLVIEAPGALDQVLRPPLFEDVVAEFGNRVVLAPEAKSSASGQRIVDTLLRFDVHPDAAVVSSFNLDELRPALAAGYHAMALGDRFEPAALRAAGIAWVGVSAAAGADYIRGLVEAGLRVVVWTVDDPASRDRFLALGAIGVIADDPLTMAR